MHNAELVAFVAEVNAQIQAGFVPYGGMVKTDTEFVQVMVEYNVKLKDRAASLVWNYFSDSGAMLNVAHDPVQDLMDTAALSILEDFKKEE